MADDVNYRYAVNGVTNQCAQNNLRNKSNQDSLVHSVEGLAVLSVLAKKCSVKSSIRMGTLSEQAKKCCTNKKLVFWNLRSYISEWLHLRNIES